MGRPIGLPKTGGRKQGTPNKDTNELRELLEDRNISIPDKLMDLLPKLTPEKQVNVLLGLLPYLYPRRKEVGEAIALNICESCQGISDMSDEELNRELAKLDSRRRRIV